MEYLNELDSYLKKKKKKKRKKEYDIGYPFQLQIIFSQHTLYNFKQYIDNENVYMAKERVWYDVGYPNRNWIVDWVILGPFINICFPTRSSISLLFYREIY